MRPYSTSLHNNRYGIGFVPVGVIGHDGLLVPADAFATPPPVFPDLPSPPASGAMSTKAAITLSLRDGVGVRIDGDIGLPALQCVLKTVLGLA